MFKFSESIQRTMTAAVTSILLLPGVLRAEDHVVSLSELREKIVSASKSRQSNVSTIEKLLSSPVAEKAIKRAGLDRNTVVRAVATLSDDEVSRLSARAERAQQDIAAGALSNQELTYIVIALATAVIILVIVAA